MSTKVSTERDQEKHAKERLSELIEDGLNSGSGRALTPEVVDQLKIEARSRWLYLEIIAIIPEYHQVKVKCDIGHQYSLTRKTEGFYLSRCTVGNKVRCLVTSPPDLPRVLRVEFVD
jgi:hypothetical protein